MVHSGMGTQQGGGALQAAERAGKRPLPPTHQETDC